MTEQILDLQYGVDLITFYDPAFWGASSDQEVLELWAANPVAGWSRVFSALNTAGITNLELTFPPADFGSAITAFGSADGFRRAAESEGLRIKSGFFAGLLADGDANVVLDEAKRYADFLAAAGADVMVAGLPMRGTWDSAPPQFVDLEFAKSLSDRIHQIGYATAVAGVTTALHTEAHSVFSTPRDIELFLSLTDPTYVAFCPDTAHITLAGGDPVQIARAHTERIVIAHWKDAKSAMSPMIQIDEGIHKAHRAYMSAMGEGVVDWDAWMSVFATTPAAGLALLELDAVADPITEMTAAKAFLEEKNTHPIR